MNISAPFIQRPIATTLLTAATVLAGVAAFRELPVSPLPQVEFPTVSVQASLPGASPEIMASSVASPLEREFGRIAGVTEMTAQSTLGQTSVTLQFDLSRNIDAAARDVESAINAARSYLPANLPSNPTYRKVNPADAPIMIIALSSGKVAPSGLYDAASTVLLQRVSQIEGVGQVAVGGSSAPAVRISVNPTQLNGYGLQLADVRAAVAAQTVLQAMGSVSNADKRWAIASNDQLMRAADYRPLIVSYRSGAAVRLADVATVQDSVQSVRSMGLANGRPAALLIIFRQPGANIITTVDSIKAALPQLHASIDPSIEFTIALDQTQTIRASVKDIERTLVISIVLVVLVVFLFLREFRSTLIPLVAVPTSIIGTLAVMYLCGYSIDNLSLMALAISTGFVVDDAIVVLENITRYREQGMGTVEAAIKGAAEIGSTVVSMSLSLVAVFIPILLMGGIIGRLFREFAVVLSVTILVSLVVSLTTTPMMCAMLLVGDRKHGRLYQAGERLFAWILQGYERSLGWVLERSIFVLWIAIATVALSVYLYVVVPKGFFPQQDTGRLSGNIVADQAISFTSMQKKIQSLAAIVLKDPGVSHVLAFTGGGGGTTTNTGRVFISLKPLAERKVTADRIIDRLRPKLAAVPGATLFLQAVQDVRIGGRRSNAEFQYTIQSDNLQSLNQWGPILLEAMKSARQLRDVNSDAQNKGLSANLVIDRATAARLGVSVQALDEVLYDAFGERNIATMYTPLNQYYVVMVVDPVFWQNPRALESVYVASGDGAMVPLGAFTHYGTATAPLAVNHSSVFPSVTFSFNLAPGVALGDAVKSITAAERAAGMPSSITGAFSGTAQAFSDSLANEPLLIAAAIVAVYVVLGILYESYIHPITILSTIPSAGVGALLALLLTHTELSVIALIGIILLIGIVKKNAIMMIDFAIEVERRDRKTPKEAVFQACLLRFRPIMMTTMAALLGGVPLAIGTGMGAELRRPLGIAIVGGLIVSQALTLYTTPVVYLYMDRLNTWVSSFGLAAPTGGAPSGGGGVAGRAVAGLGLVLLSMAMLMGCNLAPPYEPPRAVTSAAYKEVAPASAPPAAIDGTVFAGDVNQGWKIAAPQDALPGSRWWEIYQDPQLSELEERVAISNQTVAAAEANYRAARALVAEAQASLYPTLSLAPSVTRSRSSAAVQANGGGPVGGTTTGATTTDGATASGASASPRTTYSLPLEAAYQIDLWGSVRNTVAQNRYNAQASAAQVAAALLSTQSQLAQAYFELRVTDEQRRVLDATLADYRSSRQLVDTLFNNGLASALDIASADTQLAAAEAQATDLGVVRAQYEHAIAVLIGVPPASFSLPYRHLQQRLPAIPVGVPSDLLERRPDIATAERQVAAANAAIGVARAAYFPDLTLSASGGYQSTSLGRLLDWPNRFWSIGPAVAQTLFDGGARRAATARARALDDQAVANYRQTVLGAFQSVEDNLATLRILSLELTQQHTAAAAAERTVELSLVRYRDGIDSYVNVITAQNALLTAQEAELQVQMRELTASVNLVNNLGGGWNAGPASALP